MCTESGFCASELSRSIIFVEALNPKINDAAFKSKTDTDSQSQIVCH